MAGTVLVTDADRGNAVAIIRSLGRRGWRVVAADSKPRSLGFHSRYTRERLVYPPPESAAWEFIAALERAAGDLHVDLLIPVTDEVLQPLAHARKRLEAACRLAIPGEASLQRTADKSRTLELARSLGVPVPATRVVESEEEACEAARSLPWPLVVKPAFSRRFDPERGVVEASPVSYANDPGELAARLRALGGRQKVLLQEYCRGVGCGVEMVALGGRPVAAFQHRRLAEVPLSGGASAWRESVPLDPELFGHAARLVAALEWTGWIMVEFKAGDPPCLMEINGRAWGSLPLALHSGMDFPALLADLYCGDLPQPGGRCLAEYRVGVRAYNPELLVSWIVQVLRGKKKYPYLPFPARKEALAALAALLSPRQKRDLSSADDHRPAIAELFEVARHLARKVTRTGRRREC